MTQQKNTTKKTDITTKTFFTVFGFLMLMLAAAFVYTAFDSGMSMFIG